jgi:hypothetical protein
MAPGDDPAAGPVWLDLEHEQLRRGDKALHLRSKSFALLRCCAIWWRIRGGCFPKTS